MGYRLPLVTSVAIFLLLIAGSLVVGFKAGLACPDWPLCNGKWIPPMEGKVLIEYAHRMLSLLVTLLMGWNGIVAWKHRKMAPLATRLTFFSFFLLLVVAVSGGINVLLKLPPGFTAIDVGVANLLFATYILITVLLYEQKNAREKEKRALAAQFRPALVATCSVFVQLVFGAFVEHSKAGAIMIQGQYRLLNVIISSPYVAEVMVNLHLIATYGVVASILWLVFRSVQKKVLKWQRRILSLLLALQMVAGFLTFYSKLALFSTVIHLALASLLVAVCVWITVQTKMANSSL